MRTIDLQHTPLTTAELLNSARDDVLLVKQADGTNFLVSIADDFELEVELLRRNHDFLAFLDARERDQPTYTLDEVERRLSLIPDE